MLRVGDYGGFDCSLAGCDARDKTGPQQKRKHKRHHRVDRYGVILIPFALSLSVEYDFKLRVSRC